MPIESNEQIEKPTNIGSAVSFTYLPIRVLIGTDIKVEINPVIAAPIPAICPIGSMAKALRFPKRNPIAKNCNPKNSNRISMEGFPLFANKMRYKMEMPK